MKKLITILLLCISLNGYSQTVQSIDDFMQKWIGKPYKFGGRTEFGIDCSNFVARLYKDVFDKKIPSTCIKLWKATNRIEDGFLQIGDLIFFDSPVSPSGWHVGIYIGDDKFIHAANRKEGVKISCIDEPYYKKHYKGAGRF